MNDKITSNDLKWNEHGFEDEEVVAGGDTEGFVDIPASEADKGGRYGKVSDHFSHS